jgi:hypothetical protein
MKNYGGLAGREVIEARRSPVQQQGGLAGGGVKALGVPRHRLDVVGVGAAGDAGQL